MMVLEDITPRKSLSKKPERKRIQSRNQIFVTGLPRYLSRGSIEQYFERFGQIKVKSKGEKLVYLFTDKHGNFDGRCKVTYEYEDTARNTVDLLHGEDYKDTGSVLHVSMALVNYFGQKNIVKSSTDWICKTCSDKEFERINFHWQNSCYNCRERNRDIPVNYSPEEEKSTECFSDNVINCDRIKEERQKEVNSIEILNIDCESEDLKPYSREYVEMDKRILSPISTKRKSVEKIKINHEKDSSFITIAIEKEMEDVLLNTFMNHEMFKKCFPLSVKINVSKHIKRESFPKVSKQKIHVNLQVSDDILSMRSSKSNEEFGIRGENITDEANDIKGNIDIALEDNIDADINFPQESVFDQDFATPSRNIDQNDCSSPRKRKSNNIITEDATGSKITKCNQDDSLTNPSTSQSSTENGSEKGRKKFTFDQDKEILDKVIEVLPGRSLASLELSDPILKLLSSSLSRCESSISSRWKFSLRVWLIQYYSKNNKTWKNFGQASFNRRKSVSNYFHKLVKKKGLKIEVMNAITK